MHAQTPGEVSWQSAVLDKHAPPHVGALAFSHGGSVVVGGIVVVVGSSSVVVGTSSVVVGSSRVVVGSLSSVVVVELDSNPQSLRHARASFLQIAEVSRAPEVQSRMQLLRSATEAQPLMHAAPPAATSCAQPPSVCPH